MKSAKSQVFYQLENITPKRAAEILKMNTFNRPLSKPHLAFLCKCLQNGEWKVNADSIRISPENVLLDGQHRLTAVIETGITIKSYVAYNVPKDTFDTIDSGLKPRGGADVLALRGEKNYTLLAGTVRGYFVYTNKFWSNTKEQKLSNQQIEDILDENPHIRNSVSIVVKHRKGLAPLAQMRLFAVCHAIFSLISKVDADDFIKKLSSGAELKEHNPVLVLRNRLIENKSSIRKFNSHHAMALIIKSWNVFRKNNYIKCLKWDAEKEGFPVAK